LAAAAPDVGSELIPVLGARVRSVGEAEEAVATVGSVVGDTEIGAVDGARVAVAEGLVEGLPEAMVVGMTVVGTVEGDAEGTSEALTVGELLGGKATVQAMTLPAKSAR
jgi:hypothetical protein